MWLDRLNVCWMRWRWGQQKERQWNRRGVWKRDGWEEDERRMAQPSVRPSYPTVHMVMTVSWWLIWRRRGPNTSATGSKPSQQPMCIRLWLMGGSIWTLCRPTDLTHSYIKNQGWLQRPVKLAYLNIWRNTGIVHPSMIDAEKSYSNLNVHSYWFGKWKVDYEQGWRS